MVSDEDRSLVQHFRDSISIEFLRNEAVNIDFWAEIYQKLSLEKCLYLWYLEIVRYEYMVHGEFDEKSVETEIQLLVRIIKEKDKNSKELPLMLHDDLLRRPLQNEEISEYMIKIIKELIRIE